MKETITYDDFAKLDIRIGTITTAEVVPEADRLLRLSVDLGEKESDGSPRVRQVISGIREHFADPQELIGKQCPFVANLAPRTIKGYESEGMILAASAEEAFSLLHPHTKLPPGAAAH